MSRITPLPRSKLPPAPARVLVVSSAAQALRTLGPYLKELGYSPLLYALPPQSEHELTAIAAETPIDGIVHVFHPNLLLLDIDFGDERMGWRLIQALQLLPSTAALPCVVCIAATEFALELMPHLLAHGLRIVLKPYTRDELLRNVWAACPPATASPMTAPGEQQRLSDTGPHDTSGRQPDNARRQPHVDGADGDTRIDSAARTKPNDGNLRVG